MKTFEVTDRLGRRASILNNDVVDEAPKQNYHQFLPTSTPSPIIRHESPFPVTPYSWTAQGYPTFHEGRSELDAAMSTFHQYRTQVSRKSVESIYSGRPHLPGRNDSVGSAVSLTSQTTQSSGDYNSSEPQTPLENAQLPGVSSILYKGPTYLNTNNLIPPQFHEPKFDDSTDEDIVNKRMDFELSPTTTNSTLSPVLVVAQMPVKGDRGERPTKNPRKYRCHACSKRFTTSGHLARHSRVHAGLTDWRCPSCGSRTGRLDNCMQHYRTHGNNKNKRKGGRSFEQLRDENGVLLPDSVISTIAYDPQYPRPEHDPSPVKPDLLKRAQETRRALKIGKLPFELQETETESDHENQHMVDEFEETEHPEHPQHAEQQQYQQQLQYRSAAATPSNENQSHFESFGSPWPSYTHSAHHDDHRFNRTYSYTSSAPHSPHTPHPGYDRAYSYAESIPHSPVSQRLYIHSALSPAYTEPVPNSPHSQNGHLQAFNDPRFNRSHSYTEPRNFHERSDVLPLRRSISDFKNPFATQDDASNLFLVHPQPDTQQQKIAPMEPRLERRDSAGLDALAAAAAKEHRR